MDNQQERSSDLYFAGGLLTGEACFTVLVQTKRRDIAVFRPIFSIEMDDFITMEWLAELCKREGLPLHLRKTRNGKGMQIRAQGYKRVKRYCETFSPYLTGTKKKAAELVESFLDSRMSKHVKAPITEKEISIIEELEILLGDNRKKRSGKRSAEILRDYMPRFGAYPDKI